MENKKIRSTSSTSSSSSTGTVTTYSDYKKINNQKAPLRELEVEMENHAIKNLSNMMGKPEVFTGEKRDEKALLWVRQMERLKRAMKIEDEVMLAIVGSNFRGKAEEWWCTQEDHIVTWSQFINEFKSNFAPTELQNTMWWNELDVIQQTDNESVDNVKVKMERLCNNLGLDKDNELIIRKFYKALRKDIQYELDRDNILFKKWDDITTEARRIEMVHKKHGIVEATYVSNIIVPPTLTPTSINVITPSISASNNQHHVTSSHQKGNDVNSVLSSTLQSLCDNLAELRITVNDMRNEPKYNKSYGNNGGNSFYQKNNSNGGNGYRYNGNSGPIKCYICGVENHKSFECPNKNVQNGDNSAGKEVGQQ